MKQVQTSTNKYKVALIVLIFSISSSFSQSPYLQSINQQLRGIFQNIAYPNTDVKFLYDRSAKLADTTFYRHNSPDTLLGLTWLQLYEEMYYASHDTSWMMTRPSIEDYFNDFYADTIPIAVMDYDFYYCDNNSLTTNIYFDFDTINNVLNDKPGRPGWPFGQKNIFVVSPLKNNSTFANPVFRIDPTLFFTDNVNSSLYLSANRFKINFDDGTGWHFFDLSQLAHYQANYATSGKKGIVAKLLNNAGQAIKTSTSTLNVEKDVSSTPPNSIIDMPGLNIGVYPSCNEQTDKIIIYLEGIDILDVLKSQNRGIAQIYTDMIEEEYIGELRNFGYTYYVVDWKNSRIDMRFNALYLINLIERLKTEHQASDEQFVIIGESMGGVIARYALTFMENEAYIADNYSSFFVEAASIDNALYLATHSHLWSLGTENKTPGLETLMHKTRELITIDAPHQGANIPLSIQYAYKDALKLIFPSFNKYTSAFNIGLESHAAKQLLKYHIEGKVTPTNVSAYGPAIEHTAFYNQMAMMGDYPQYAKLVALSNGALDGSKQLDVFYDPRVAGDRILDFDASFKVKILGLEFPYFGANLKMNTNPNGYGTFFETGLGIHVFQIKLKWFKVEISSSYAGIFNDTQTGVGLKPYCVNAGGYFYTALKPIGMSSDTTGNSFYTMTSGGGCLTLDVNLGFSGILGSNHFGYDICSDGFDFGFVPVQSGLDYGKGLNMPLDHDILGENISTKLSRTPFDVIIGREYYNSGHLSFRDEPIKNITRVDAANCFINSTGDPESAYYDADLLYQCDVKRSLLCLEIGDEVMYLENMLLNRPAKYQAEYDLWVNDRNPYYEYVSQPSSATILQLKGIYSKEDNFTITNTGYAQYYFNTDDTPTGIGFQYNSPQPTTFWTYNKVKMDVCTNDYSTKRLAASTSHLSENENYLLLIPNPANTETIQVNHNIQGGKDDLLTVQLINIQGEIIFKKEYKTTTTIEIPIVKLNNGVYFVHVNNSKINLVEKLIIL